MLRNHRFIDATHTLLQAEDDAGNTLNIAADPSNYFYREQVLPWINQGNRIADFVPDPAAAARERQAKVAAQMMAAIADDAYAGKSLDQIRSEVKAALPAAGVDVDAELETKLR